MARITTVSPEHARGLRKLLVRMQKRSYGADGLVVALPPTPSLYVLASSHPAWLSAQLACSMARLPSLAHSTSRYVSPTPAALPPSRATRTTQWWCIRPCRFSFRLSCAELRMGSPDEHSTTSPTLRLGLRACSWWT
jgi:hypothetical protein